MKFLLLLPPVALIFLVFCIPLFRYSWLSFHSLSVITNLDAIPNGFANWSRLINDHNFWQALFQTIRFTVVSVSLETFFALLIALLLNNNFRGKNIIRATTILPWALPTTVMALGWRWIFNTPFGFFHKFLKIFNITDLNLLSDPNLAWIATVIADVWKTTPFISIIILAGLQSIPSDYYDAFKLEGGNSKMSFFKITLPLLRPYILTSVLFRTAQSFGVFDIIQVMTGGGPGSTTESLGLYAYRNAMRYLDFGYSSTIMIASFLTLIILMAIFWTLIINFGKLSIFAQNEI